MVVQSGKPLPIVDRETREAKLQKDITEEFDAVDLLGVITTGNEATGDYGIRQDQWPFYCVSCTKQK